MILTGESDLINPQGQNLLNNGAASLLAGLELTLYKDKAGFINNVKVGFLAGTDWSGTFPGYWQNLPGGNSTNGGLFDTALLATQAVTFAQYWTLTNTFANVYSNDVADGTVSVRGGAICNLTICSGFPTLVFDTLKLSLNDSFTGWPITFNPYVTFYYELPSIGSIGGGSVSGACFSCQVNNYDFFIGMTPTWDWTKSFGVPITWKVPTYVTVGPASFWNGNPNGLGTINPGGDVGTFTIGLTGVYNMTWMPAQYGHWFLQAGFQWYDVINTSLQVSNAVSICGNTNVTACGSGNTSSIFVGFGGIGVAF